MFFIFYHAGLLYTLLRFFLHKYLSWHLYLSFRACLTPQASNVRSTIDCSRAILQNEKTATTVFFCHQSLLFFVVSVFSSHNLLLFCVKHFQDVFQCGFLHILNLLVTTDTFNMWLPLRAKFIHCIAVKNYPLKSYSRPKLNYSSHFSSCSQFCFFNYFYFTVKQEKKIDHKKKQQKKKR